MFEKMELKLLLMLYFVHGKTLELSVNKMVNMTVSVLEHYHSTCVYLLQSTQQTDYLLKSLSTIYVNKLVKLKDLQIAVMSISTLLAKTEVNSCQENLPFYLLFSNDNSTFEKLKQISNKGIFSEARWLMFLATDINVTLDSLFTDINIPYNCEFLVIHPQHDEHEVVTLVLTEVYKYNLNQTLQTNVLAKWTNEQFLWSTTSLLKRRENLQGAILREEAKVKLKCKNFNGEFCGQLYEMWKILETRLNLQYEYLTYSEDTLNFNSGNKTWQGAIGMLETNEADVSFDAYGVTAERLGSTNYVSNLFAAKLVIFVKKQISGGSMWWRILQPFSIGFWWTVLSVLATLALILSNTWYITVHFGISQQSEGYSIYNSWVVVLGIFCQQGHDSTPSAMSCRLVYLTTYLTCIVIFASYNAIYVSLLAVQHYSVPFREFKGLLDIKTYHFGVEGTMINVGIFEKATDPVMRKIYDILIAPNSKSLPKNELEGLQRICKETNYAFLTEQDSGNIYAKLLPCEIMEIPRASIVMPVSFPISKRCPYKRLFTHHMEKLRRAGILQRIENDDISKAKDNKFTHSQAMVEDVLPILWILLLGILLSILCIIGEFLLHYFTSHKGHTVEQNQRHYTWRQI
ncbi:Ionotropic receptor 176 [Blattella germanica]|nr:Ionotropic receptor 176 [Blattella germanica]